MNAGVTIRPRNGQEGDTAPAKAIGVRVLLVSGDIQTIDTLCHFMEQMSIHLEVCSDIGAATRNFAMASTRPWLLTSRTRPPPWN
jgi:hypothetical protein